LGPSMAGYVLDGYGFISAFLTATAFSILALLPMSIGWRSKSEFETHEESISTESEKLSPEDRSKETRIIVIACLPLFIWGLLSGITNSVFPVYLSILGFASTGIGIVLMIRSVSLLISQWLGGRLSDRFNRYTLATLGVAFSISIGMIPLVNSFAGFSLVQFVSSFGVGISYSVGLTLISDLSRKRKGMGFGLFGSASTAGMAIGSQLGGAIAQYIALTAPYYFASAVTASVALLLFCLCRKNN